MKDLRQCLFLLQGASDAVFTQFYITTTVENVSFKDFQNYSKEKFRGIYCLKVSERSFEKYFYPIINSMRYLSPPYLEIL